MIWCSPADFEPLKKPFRTRDSERLFCSFTKRAGGNKAFSVPCQSVQNSWCRACEHCYHGLQEKHSGGRLVVLPITNGRCRRKTGAQGRATVIGGQQPASIRFPSQKRRIMAVFRLKAVLPSLAARKLLACGLTKIPSLLQRSCQWAYPSPLAQCARYTVRFDRTVKRFPPCPAWAFLPDRPPAKR